MYRVAEQGGQVCIIWHCREDGYVSCAIVGRTGMYRDIVGRTGMYRVA